MFSVCVFKHLLERGVIGVHSLEEPLLGELLLGQGLRQGLDICEGEVIVQGDEGPVCGVAQVVDCHGVTVSHQEREEEEEQQEVESDGEKTLKERCACPWMG